MAEPALNLDPSPADGDASVDLTPDVVDAPLARLVAGAVDGLDALYLAEQVAVAGGDMALHVTSDAPRAAQLVERIRFYAPDLDVAVLPAWDCLPYDLSLIHI